MQKHSPKLPNSLELVTSHSLIEEAKNSLVWNKTGAGYFDWVKSNWTSRGEKLDFIQHSYLNEIYLDQAPFLAFMKSAQTGITERCLTEALWIADRFSENAVYVFPTTSALSDLVQERVDEPLNNNDYLRRISGRAKKLMGKQADKVGLKRMSKGFVYFRGSNKATQITSIPADVIFADEVDRMTQENVPYLSKRLGHSDRKWERWISTPTIPNFGIHKIFLDTDQRHYLTKCNHCNHWNDLDFFENVDYIMENDTTCKEANVICSKCKQIIIPTKLEGNWVPKYPDKQKHGYYLTKLYAPYTSLTELVENSLKTAEFEVQQFYNQDLGLPYSPKGGMITSEILDACIRDYSLGERTGTNFMGVDVGLYLHVVVQNKDRVVHIDKVKDFEDLDKIVKEFDVKTCVIDALPETRKAQEFAMRFTGRVYLCYYSRLAEPKNDEWFQAHPNEMKVNTRRTLSLDNWSNRLRQQDIELPKDLYNHQEFVDHMGMLTRVVREDKKGNMISEYVRTGPDHFFHAGNYSNIAKAIYESEPEPDIVFL